MNEDWWEHYKIKLFMNLINFEKLNFKTHVNSHVIITNVKFTWNSCDLNVRVYRKLLFVVELFAIMIMWSWTNHILHQKYDSCYYPFIGVFELWFGFFRLKFSSEMGIFVIIILTLSYLHLIILCVNLKVWFWLF